MKEAYRFETQEILIKLDVDGSRGLTPEEAAARLDRNGANELKESGLRSPWKILWEQFTATMVLILIGAALLSAALGQFKDAIAIGAIVILFGLLGFFQEYRAEQAMAALKKMAVPIVRVLRGGSVQEISARLLVTGDIILLEAGNVIPADCRLIESANLRIQESALTGESEAVEKHPQALEDQELPLGDRRNMAYMGTIVTYGRGKALVVETGMRTELGKIASMLQSVENEQTPLQKRLDQVGRMLAGVGLSIAVLISVLGVLRGEPLRDMLLTSISVAVAIVPEGLPAVVTITLALGAQRMLKRRALIRKLPAVETLGSVTVICSDKTGTLTENRMTVIVLDVAGYEVDLTEELTHHMPSLEENETASIPLLQQPDSIAVLLAGSSLCNDAILKDNSNGSGYHAIGDPTEGALLVAAAKTGLYKETLEIHLPRRAELPFDSDRKRMTTIHQAVSGKADLPAGLPQWLVSSEGWYAFTKGSVDGLLEVSSHIWLDGQEQPLTEAWKNRIQQANDRLALRGMRVLGFTYRQLERQPQKQELAQIEENLVFVGLIGMIDPPRAEVKDAVQTCKSAGIRPIMITGDHPLTARQIALDLGISANGMVVTGVELNKMSEAELQEKVMQVSVFARVSPEHKLRIVRALQAVGQIVSMTGDGVNDAPALKQANIGVAMGITGTDVSKEAAEMVLQDDNFATIVAAVEEGRTIYDNLRKFIKYSVAGNIGKVLVMLLAPFLGKPLPLLPLQLLWLNLLTDGLLGLGLGVEPPEKDIMRRKPYAPNEGIFSRGLGRHVLWVGALIGGLALGVGYLYWLNDPSGPWQTMTFTTLAFAQMAQALATRSTSQSFFKLGLMSNPVGLGMALLTFSLQLAVLYLPFLQNFFGTEPLSLANLAVALGLALIVFIAIELEKLLIRSKA